MHSFNVQDESSENIQFSEKGYNNSWIPSKFLIGGKLCQIIADLQSSTSISNVILKKFANSIENLLIDTMTEVMKKIEEFFKYKNIDVNDNYTKSFLQQFNMKECFLQYKMIEEQIKALKSNHHFVKSQDIFLNRDVETELNKKLDSANFVMTEDKFQYISLIETLKLILSNEEVLISMRNQLKMFSEERFLNFHEDSLIFKEHSFLKKYEDALGIHLYFDEFLLDNPFLENKIEDEKIGAFYFSISNFPAHLNHCPGNVYILALCNKSMIDKYGIKKILKPFIAELKQLEDDNGLSLSTNDSSFLLRCTLLTVNADTLVTNYEENENLVNISIMNMIQESESFSNSSMEFSAIDIKDEYEGHDSMTEANSVFENNAKSDNDNETVDEDKIEHKTTYCRCNAFIKNKVKKMNIPVREWIKEMDLHSDNKLEKMLDAGLTISHATQVSVSKFVCNKMKHLWGNHYPPHCLKIKVAKKLVSEFPPLKSSKPEHVNGYEHWSNGNYGMFDSHFKYERVSLDSSEKKNVKRKNAPNNDVPAFVISSEMSEQEIYDKKIERLKVLSSNDKNKSEIFQLMKETRESRKRELSTSRFDGEQWTLNAILNRFPKFLDFNGLLIEEEFSELYPQKKVNLVQEFPAKCTKKIIDYCRKNFNGILNSLADITDDNLKAIAVLPFLLKQKLTSPETQKRRGRKRKIDETTDLPLSQILRFLSVKQDLLESHIKQKGKLKPVIICAMPDSQKRNGKYYVRVERKLSFIGENFLQAFNILFKLHLVFNVPFPEDLIGFYTFMKKFINFDTADEEYTTFLKKLSIKN